MTFPEALHFLESFVNYEKIPEYPYKESLKLDRVRGFLHSINDPQQSLRCIHVAGTKGKGSTCAFIAYILREAGLRVGLYTSPHLSDFRERIRILRPRGQRHQSVKDFEGMIAKHELADLVQELKPRIETYNRHSLYGSLTFFEVYTSLAFLYFKKQKTDIVVLETGLGGRLDATNVVDALVAVLTPISYEHTQKLGSTLQAIAREKAGIIKETNAQTRSCGSVVVTAPQKQEALKVIRERAAQVHAAVIEIGKHVLFESHRGHSDVRAAHAHYRNLSIPLLGEHQLLNVATAIAAIEVLKDFGIVVSRRAIRRGIALTRWPGRCEIMSTAPLIVLDGAQNVASAKVLRETINSSFSFKKLWLIFGISKDKDIKGVCRILDGFAGTVFLTKAQNPRGEEPKRLKSYFKKTVSMCTHSVKEALLSAQEVASREDCILVTGSLFVVGEAREFFSLQSR